MLQEVLLSLPKEEAERHLQRCIDSGMWVQNAAEAQAKAEGGADTTETKE